MTHFNTSSSPHPKCKGALDKHEGHEHHEHHEHHHKKKNDVPGNDKYVYKRSLEIAQEMQEMQEMQEIEGNGTVAVILRLLTYRSLRKAFVANRNCRFVRRSFFEIFPFRRRFCHFLRRNSFGCD